MNTEKPFAITLDVGSSLANHTGAWRTQRPVYVDRLPPCNGACPAGENVQGWLYHAESGDYEQAWRKLIEENPLPAIMGRVCYHPCETACNRGKLDQAVGINSVERFLGDLAIARGWQLPQPPAPTGNRVLVVGAGPSGLAAAYHLRRLGHEVEIRDASPEAGGMMRYGIPRYRLPREVLDAEVARIVGTGVKLTLGCKVDHVAATMTDEKFDACFMAIGAHLARRIEIPAPDAARIVDALTLLGQLAGGAEGLQIGRLQIGRSVVVIGGGNTAIDAARSAKRLGAEDAIILYRRSWAEMPAHESEIIEALDEGVTVRWLREIRRFAGPDRIVVERMTRGPDGKPQPTGELEELAADTVVLALGQSVDTSVLSRIAGVVVGADGTVQVDGTLMTGHRGVFAGGDMVPAERSVTVAVGHGKKAARCIDAYLRSQTFAPPPRHADASFDRLNSWYYGEAPRTIQPFLARARRRSTFEEVREGLTEENALFEARRCLSCGNCFECDNCYGVCPDNAVVKLGPGKRYRFDLDFCKGCGLCAKECPCGAIDMVPEET